MDLNAIKHIIWDWNGTLVNDAQRCVDIMNTIRSRRSMPPITLDDYREHFDFPVIEYYRSIGFDLSKHPFEVLSEEFISSYINSRQDLPLHEGALEALKFFRSRSMPQCVVSATQSDALRQTLHEHGIVHFFKTTLGLDHHYADDKAHLGKKWLNQNVISKERVLFIGDTLHDKAVADQMGVSFILISNGHHSKVRLKQSTEHVVDSLSDLIKLFTQT